MDQQTLLDVAQKYGTPLYLYNLQTILEQINNLKKYLNVAENTEFLYAAKANPNPHIIKEIVNQGFGLDAVSLEEAKLGLYCGASSEKIILTENNITDTEMESAHDLGILINIGSLSRLEKFGKKYSGENVCVRLNTEVGGAASHDTNITVSPYSKFGTSVSKITEIKKIAEKYNLKIIGLHFHVGSGWLSPAEPLRALEIFLQAAKKFSELQFLDLGGGFGVPYRPEQNHLDLQQLGKSLRESLQIFFAEYGRQLKVRFEPGRYVLAEAGQLLAEVNTIKEVSGRLIAGTNTGMNQLVRVAMYDAYHPIRNISNLSGQLKKYDITGNVCESADFFAKDREIAEVREGDILSIDIAGAYGMSMASNYQFRPLPAEILLDNETLKVIRPRQSFQNLIEQY